MAGFQIDALRARTGAKEFPTPEKFPATFDDFLKLAIGHDASELFDEFITDKAKAHLAGGDSARFEVTEQSLKLHFQQQVDDQLRELHAGASDEEIAGRLFNEEFARATALWRNQFAQGFETKTSWLAALREYAAWTNRQQKK